MTAVQTNIIAIVSPGAIVAFTRTAMLLLDVIAEGFEVGDTARIVASLAVTQLFSNARRVLALPGSLPCR